MGKMGDRSCVVGKLGGMWTDAVRAFDAILSG
jgi:hypothetical protein